MLTKSQAIAKLRSWMRERHPKVKKFTATTHRVKLTHYGYAACWWDSREGRMAVEWPEPYQVGSR